MEVPAERSQPAPDSDDSSSLDPASRRSSTASLSNGELRKFILEERAQMRLRVAEERARADAAQRHADAAQRHADAVQRLAEERIAEERARADAVQRHADAVQLLAEAERVRANDERQARLRAERSIADASERCCAIA